MGIENMNFNNNEQAESTEVKKNRLFEWIKRNPPVRNLMIGAAAIGTFLAFSGESKAQEKPGDMPIEDKTEFAIGADEHKDAPGVDADSVQVRTEAKLDASNQTAEKVKSEEKGVEITKSFAAPTSFDSHRGVVDLDLSTAEEVTIQTFNQDGKPIEAKKFKGKADVFYAKGYTYRILDSKGNLIEKLDLNRDQVLAMDVQKKKLDIEQQKKNLEENLKQQINKIDQEKGSQ